VLRDLEHPCPNGCGGEWRHSARATNDVVEGTVEGGVVEPLLIHGPARAVEEALVSGLVAERPAVGGPGPVGEVTGGAGLVRQAGPVNDGDPAIHGRGPAETELAVRSRGSVGGESAIHVGDQLDVQSPIRERAADGEPPIRRRGRADEVNDLGGEFVGRALEAWGFTDRP